MNRSQYIISLLLTEAGHDPRAIFGKSKPSSISTWKPTPADRTKVYTPVKERGITDVTGKHDIPGVIGFLGRK